MELHNGYSKKISKLGLLLGIVLSACAGEDGFEEGSDLEIQETQSALISNPQVAGPYAACYYTSNISRSQYANPRMYYPCAAGTAPSGAMISGVVPATTLSPGYTNAASTIFWLGEHAASHGFVVLAMQPDNIWGVNSEWRDAHVDAYNELLDENARAASPVFQKINLNKIQIMGFSKGGGGTLMAAQQLTSQGKVIGAVQALAPYYDSWNNVNLITAPTAIHGGSSDSIAPTGSHAVPMFNGLAAATPRLLAIYSGLSHTEWYSGSGIMRYKMKQYITAWMQVHLNGDSGYQAYINGASHQAGWFTTYTYDP